jgi:hypothetical protein
MGLAQYFGGSYINAFYDRRVELYRQVITDQDELTAVILCDEARRFRDLCVGVWLPNVIDIGALVASGCSVAEQPVFAGVVLAGGVSLGEIIRQGYRSYWENAPKRHRKLPK